MTGRDAESVDREAIRCLRCAHPVDAIDAVCRECGHAEHDTSRFDQTYARSIMWLTYGPFAIAVGFLVVALVFVAIFGAFGLRMDD